MNINAASTRNLRFSIGVICGVILAGLVSFYLVNRYTIDQLLNSFGQRSFALATLTISEVDRTIQERLGYIEVLSKRVSTSEVLLQSNADFEELTDIDEYITQIDSQWINTPAHQTNSDIEAILNNPLSLELQREFLSRADSVNNYATFAEVIITNKYGANVALTNRTTDYYQADEQWWQRTRTQPYVIADIDFDESSNTQSISISTPIRDETGQFLGALKVVWNIEEIIDLLRIIELERKDSKIFGNTTNVTLLTADNKVIYSSKNEFDLLEEIQPDDIEYAVLQQLSDEFYTIVESTVNNSTVTHFVTHAKSTGFSNFEGLNWILILEQDTEEILSPIRRTQLFIGVIFIVFTAITIYLSWVYSYHLAKVQKLKDEFLSLASHQLKSPITQLRYAFELIRDANEELPPETKRWLADAEGSVASMNKLVQDLLNLSRLESGRLEINPEPSDLAALTQKLVQDHQLAAEKRQITFELDLRAENLEQVLIDPSIYKLILDNMLSNAVKYSKDGGQVTVSLYLNDERDYEIKVQDQGVGIPEASQENIFQKFYRAENVEQSQIKGTGLGLFEAAKIIKGMGNKIWFESEENVGSSFYFTISKHGMPKKKIKAG